MANTWILYPAILLLAIVSVLPSFTAYYYRSSYEKLFAAYAAFHIEGDAARRADALEEFEVSSWRSLPVQYFPWHYTQADLPLRLP